MSSFKEFIRNNPSILKTLFHVDDDGIKVIDNNSREIIKNYRTAKLFRFLPILKDILEEILKDISTIKLIIIDLEAVGYVSDNEKYTYNDMLTLVEKIVEERLNKENQLNVDFKRFLELLNDTTKWTEEKEKVNIS